jgi:hypothetical protein
VEVTATKEERPRVLIVGTKASAAAVAIEAEKDLNRVLYLRALAAMPAALAAVYDVRIRTSGYTTNIVRRGYSIIRNKNSKGSIQRCDT